MMWLKGLKTTIVVRGGERVNCVTIFPVNTSKTKSKQQDTQTFFFLFIDINICSEQYIAYIQTDNLTWGGGCVCQVRYALLSNDASECTNFAWPDVMTFFFFLLYPFQRRIQNPEYSMLTDVGGGGRIRYEFSRPPAM